jgi:tetratricopeptide (TPR) repeat protein
MKVTAKTSSFYFKGKNIDVGEIAQQLQVGTILEGSVQKAGNRVRVIAQLINADDGTHYWSKNFDRDLQDIFAVQDEIAREVVEALKVTLLDSEEERLAQRYQPSLEAYEQLILGRREMAMRTADTLAAAEQHFKQAIELDPGYSLAYIGLADTYTLQEGYSGLTYEEMVERTKPLIVKALELDPFSGEAYTTRAELLLRAHNFEGAEAAFLRAIELNPSYATAYHWYNDLLNRQGRFEEGLAPIRMASELDPMAPIIQLSVAWSLWFTGRVEEALIQLRRNIERNPGFTNNYWYMGDTQIALGHIGEAQRWFQEARKLNPDGPLLWRDQCMGLLHLGSLASAEDCMSQLIEAHPEKVTAIRTFSFLHFYRGEWDAAISIRESILEKLPERAGSTWVLAGFIARQGEVERAHRMMVDAFPEFLTVGLELSATDLAFAMTFAAILHANGETQKRDILFNAIEKQIATMHRTRGRGFGILDVYIHAMRGDRDKAITALRDAIDVGWRGRYTDPYLGCWWMLRQDWKLASLHQDPEFIAMVDELEADIAAQRRWYEENKDKPLF